MYKRNVERIIFRGFTFEIASKLTTIGVSYDTY